MNKILVDVFCPATSTAYDFWIPKKMTVETATKKISEEICAHEGNELLFGDRQRVLLFSRKTERVLAAAGTLEECGVRGGDRLAIL